MSKQLKQINLRLMNSSTIPLAFYRNSDQANLMLLYNSKALKEKLDKILGKFQIQQRKFLQRNFSCGTYDSKDSLSNYLSFSQSTSPRQYFYWDSKVAQSISMKKNRKNETLSSIHNSNIGGSTRHNRSHYRGFLNNFKRAYSVSDFTQSFKITNFSQLKVKPLNSMTDRKVIKLKQTDKKIFKELTKQKNQQETTSNSEGLGLINSKLFGNVFLRKKVLEN